MNAAPQGSSRSSSTRQRPPWSGRDSAHIPAEVTPASDPIITVDHLHKAYGSTVAVEDVALSIEEGEIFGVIGPNGAGKTTTVECISGLRTPDAGTIKVLGLEPARERGQLHEWVGVQLQEGSLPPRMRVGEALDLFASFYSRPANVDELIDALGLGEKRRVPYRRLSGGQKQRLSIALALIGNPKVAILDELTTGLDPEARRDTWRLIEHVRDRGVTVLLVTHYMDEAERLCDRVALIDRGNVVVTGTPAAIAEREGGGRRLRFVPSAPFDERVLTALPGVTGLEREGRHLVVSGSGDLVTAVINVLAFAGVEVSDVRVSEGSLEDAFVRLTHRPAGVDEVDAR